MNLLYNFSSASVGKPSFFEMFLESQMMPSLKPAIEYIIEVFVQRYPSYYSLLNYTDEAFYTFLLILERHYLKHYDGSFAENFYGLKRAIVTSGTNDNPPPLRMKHKLSTLFFLVVLPYIKTKLDKLYTKLDNEHNRAANNNNTNTNTTAQQRHKIVRILCSILYSVYPYLVASYEGSLFIYQLLYMYGYSIYYDPFLHIQGLHVTRQTSRDKLLLALKLKQQEKHRKSLLKEKGKLVLIWLFLVDGVRKILDYTQYLLPITIFFFKFLEWWYNEPRFQQSTNDMTPPPPHPPKMSTTSSIKLPEDKSKCGLCKETRTNPSISISGFVFCYPCLHEYVNNHRECPITKQPMETEQIRKIYDDNDNL
eukprot:TRINITY_DN3054_c1_g1_i5.p2 TRINITY_DN3054_c1_g1~~TRINITY_DN3054_c1_g1_i5.p2  ORF type:complete len:366 (+),score=63.15 TRINITY_DN3054_c1_g1_i5:39-1136(+)